MQNKEKLKQAMQPLFDMIKQDFINAMEVYKEIPNTNGRYFASNYGNIKSFTKHESGLIMKPRTDYMGYHMVNLWQDGKRKTYRVHVLVCLAFLGQTPKGSNIDHKDQDKQNNKLDNLQFLTIRQNVAKAQNLAKKSNLPTGISRQPPMSYRAVVRHEKGRYHLGSSKDLAVCVALYEKALDQINKGTFDISNLKKQPHAK
jgi:hypothetical protein